MSDRRAAIAGNLDQVRDRIASACARSGRSADEVTLTVVTKFFPASDVRLLAELGVRHVGENRHQEAEAKAAECADLGLTWHFIGGLQSNKAAAVAAYADVVESVDRAKLLTRPVPGRPQRDRERRRPRAGQPRPGPGARRRPRGRRPADVDRRSPSGWRQAEGLRLRGVMAVAPLGADPAAAFAKLAAVAAAGAPRRPRRDVGLGRDERRPRGRRRIRRDTRADRQRGAR